METIDIRQAVTREELERVYDLWGTVFPEDRAFFQERLDYDPAYRMETTWLALVDGTLASAVQIFPYWMRWGSVRLKVGGIGNVATQPEYRRRGLAQQILRRQSEYMKAQGYDLSLLMTGINPFYEQLGWRTIPEMVLSVDAEAIRKELTDESCRIRRFEETDLEQVRQIYEEMTREMSAPMVRTAEYWQGQAAWGAIRPENFLIAETSGVIVAFLRFKITKNNQLLIGDCCYKPDAGFAASALLGRALEAAVDVGTVRANLPEGHALLEWLKGAGASAETVTGNMWKPFGLAATLGRMAPELTRAIRRAGLEGGPDLPAALLFSVGGEDALLHVRKESVEAEPVTGTARYNQAYTLSEAEWLTLLLKGSSTLDIPNDKGGGYLRALFPGHPYVFWNADHF